MLALLLTVFRYLIQAGKRVSALPVTHDGEHRLKRWPANQAKE